MSNFEKLNNINVNEKTEKKNGLTYLSWAWAWSEFCKVFPDATYKVYKDEQTGLPYVYDENTGYMCYVEVTAGGKTHEMWLPVMDSANNAMKAREYEVKTKYKTVTVKPATMFDINKTIMRCLVKCLAMFGLGLYIYAGEDLPEDLSAEAPKEAFTREELVEKVKALAEVKGITEKEICDLSKSPIESISEMNESQLHSCLDWLKVQ